MLSRHASYSHSSLHLLVVTVFRGSAHVAIAHVHYFMQTSVDRHTKHELMMPLCAKQPKALEQVQKLMVQSLKEAVKEFSVPDSSADVAALCAAAATTAAAGES